jgi:putative ABC transport system substrate-binding protein
MAHLESDPEFQDYLGAFREGLQKLGWTEGRNIQIDVRWGALDDAEGRQRSAKELVALRPDLIVTQNTPPTAALKEIAPHVTRAAILFNPATTPYANIYVTPFKTAAPSFGLEATTAIVHDKVELETAIAAQARDSNGGLIVMPDGFLNVHRADLVSLAASHRIPTVYPWRFFPEQGGLLSYGSEMRDEFRLAAEYADRILKGEKPADLPVQAPTKYELVINLRTAKTLGLNVSQQFQQLADKV